MIVSGAVLCGMHIDDLPDAIRRRVTLDDNGCWIWTGYIATTRYGLMWWDGRTRLVHRVVYGLAGGDLSADTLDHLCRVRHCCRPDHLEPCGRGENTLRGDSLPARNLQKTVCPRGHAYSHTDRRGWRKCRECERLRKAERRAQAAGRAS